MITSFQDWLNEVRKSRRLSLKEFGTALGYSNEAVRKYERRGHRPSLPFVAALAEFLGLSEQDSHDLQVFACSERADVPRYFPDWLVALASAATAPRGPTNLPRPLTRLVGRDEDVGRLVRLLADREGRLVCVTGPAGIGKTRLAVAAAHRMRELCEDGVFFVELSSVRQPHELGPAIASVLRVREAAGRSLDDTLYDYLRGKHMLLVLDNLEQVVDTSDGSSSGIAQQFIGGLVRSSAHLKVLATSRVKLRIRGEHLHMVNPLRLPSPAQTRQLDALAETPAVALFLDRTRELLPDFQLDGASAQAIAEICRFLEGIPLAIELAAARMDSFEPSEIRVQLRERTRLAVLTDGALDQRARHVTLQAAIDWSFDLLDARRAMLFSLLGVFVGGFLEEAAAELIVAQDIQDARGQEVRKMLKSLADASLLRAGRGTNPRYTMLETIREYAVNKLNARGEPAVQHAKSRHAHYFVQLAQMAEPELVGSDQVHWLQRLELEHDNVRAALRWLLEHGQAELAARIAGALWRFWWTHGHLTEGRQWLDAVLVAEFDLDSRTRAQALAGNGVLARSQRDFTRATDLLEQALTIWRTLGDNGGAALALANLGIVAENLRDYAAARACYTESLALRREQGDRRSEAHMLNNLAVVAMDEGDFDTAEQLDLASLRILDELQVDAWGRALVQRNLGWIALAKHQLQSARQWLESSLELSQSVEDPEGRGNTLNNLALLEFEEAVDTGGYHRAASIATQGLRLLHDIGERGMLTESLEILGACLGRLGEMDIAARCFGAAEAVRAAIHMFRSPSYERMHRDMVAVARRGVDQERWQLAWDAGRAQPDAVIADALNATRLAPGAGSQYHAQMEHRDRHREHQTRD